MTNFRVILVVFIIAMMVLGFIYGCVNIGWARYTPVEGVDPGFVTGWFHGLIAIPAFFWGILVDHTVTIYAHNANTHWYDLGFIFAFAGAMSLSGRN